MYTTRSTPRKKRKGAGLLRKLRTPTGRTTIHLTAEDDWETEVPNVRLSRVFAVVLILHVVAVGGILAFQMLNPETAAGDAPAIPPATGAAREPELARAGDIGSLTDALPKPPKIGDDEVDGLRHYRVQSGDNLMVIARRFGVPIDGLERLNNLDAGQELHPGLILYLPNKRTVTGTQPEDVEALFTAQARPDETSSPAAPPAPPEPAARRALPVGEPAPALGRVETTAARPAAPGPPRAVLADAAPATSPRPAASPAAKKVVGGVEVYTIAQGDTAYAIGLKYGIHYDELLRLNGIEDARTLRPGQTLKIPVTR